MCRTPRRMRRSALFFCPRPGRACPKNSPARPSTLFESGPPSFLGLRNASPRSFVPCSAAPPRNPGGPLSPTSALAGFSSRAQTGARCTSPDASHSRSRPGRPSLEQTGIRPWGASVPCEPRGRVSHLSGFCLFRPTSLTRTGPRAAGPAFGCSGERGACRPPLDDSAIAAHRIALADPFGRLGSLACSAKRRHLDRVAGLPPKQLLAVSEKLSADFASLDGFALRFTSHRLRRPLQAADSLARLVKRRSLHCVPGRPIETACGCFGRAGELRRPVQLSATKARRNQTPVPDCPAETARGCFRGPEQLQAVRSREMSKEREID